MRQLTCTQTTRVVALAFLSAFVLVLILKQSGHRPSLPEMSKFQFNSGQKPELEQNFAREEPLEQARAEPEGNEQVQVDSDASNHYKSVIVDKSKFPMTDYRDSLKLKEKKFWEAHKPTYTCPAKLLHRIGNPKDGGKWVCGLETLAKLTLEKGYKCVVYSFGIGKDSTFEAEILQSTLCSIYAFDPTVKKTGRPFIPGNPNPRFQFNKVGIAGKNGGNKKTLLTSMKERGHTFIDILKIDVEGFEYDSLNQMMKDFKELPFGQLQLEVHNSDFKHPKKVQRVLDLITNLEKKGARVFSVEPNALSAKACSEYSFINLDYLKLFLE